MTEDHGRQFSNGIGTMMTRKDYVLIAQAIKRTRELIEGNPSHNITGSEAMDFITGYFGGRLEQDNPRFDYERFRLACGSKP